jgi:hypothetical protein
MRATLLGLSLIYFRLGIRLVYLGSLPARFWTGRQ